MKKTCFILLSSVFIIVSCNSGNKEELKKSYLGSIDSLENVLKQTQTINNKAANDLVNTYTAYAENFPNDSITPDYLFKAGEIASSIKQGEKAINIFETLCEKYSSYKKVQYSLFLQAFIYETQINNLQKAREFYEQVIEKYPNEPIANDAKACIENLGKSEEELIKEFEEKNKKES